MPAARNLISACDRRTLQFSAGVVQSIQPGKLPMALGEILMMPGSLPVLVKNLRILLFKGAAHSGLVEQ